MSLVTGRGPLSKDPAGWFSPPLPEGAFRIGDLGGWKAVNQDVFGKSGVWTKVLLGE